MVSKGWWSESEDADLVKKTKSDVMKAFTRAEKLPKPKLSEMFNDVWAVQPGEKVPTIIVSPLTPHAKLMSVDGTESGAWSTVEEVRRCLGTLAQGEDAIRRAR